MIYEDETDVPVILRRAGELAIAAQKLLSSRVDSIGDAALELDRALINYNRAIVAELMSKRSEGKAKK